MSVTEKDSYMSDMVQLLSDFKAGEFWYKALRKFVLTQNYQKIQVL